MITYIKNSLLSAGIFSMLFLTSCVEVKPDEAITNPTDNTYINTLHSGSAADLKDMHFFNASKGVVIGGQDYLTTSDAGLNWAISKPVKADGDTIAHFNKIAFVNDLKGVLTGDTGYEYYDSRKRLRFKTTGNVILQTEDGGQTWNDINFFKEVISVNALKFYDENTGLLAVVRNKDGELYKTNDGGSSWQLVLSGIKAYGHHLSRGTRGLADITYITKDKVIAVGTQGTVYMSLDGGDTWKKDNTAPKDRAFKRVTFFNETEGYIIGGGDSFPNEDKAMVFKITLNSDGTISYQDKTDTYYSVFYFNGLYASKTGNLWVCGHLGQIFATYDQGTTWSDELTKTNRESKLNDLEFPTDEIGYFVGDDGIILKVNLAE